MAEVSASETLPTNRAICSEALSAIGVDAKIRGVMRIKIPIRERRLLQLETRTDSLMRCRFVFWPLYVAETESGRQVIQTSPRSDNHAIHRGSFPGARLGGGRCRGGRAEARGQRGRHAIRPRILKAAAAALRQPPMTITAFPAKLSQGGPNDFYSNGDYWWPDPRKPDGLPYIQHDGQSNPGNFSQHRLAMRTVRDCRGRARPPPTSSPATIATRQGGRVAPRLLPRSQDADESHSIMPRPSPACRPAAATASSTGCTSSRSRWPSGALEKSKAFPPAMGADLRQWFGELAEWMTTSKNGQEEGRAKNNHAVAFYLQARRLCRLQRRRNAGLAECRRQFKEVFVAEADGGRRQLPGGTGPHEALRLLDFPTRQHGHAVPGAVGPRRRLCGRSKPRTDASIRKAVAYLYPYLADKSKWTRKPDVQA